MGGEVSVTTIAVLVVLVVVLLSFFVISLTMSWGSDREGGEKTSQQGEPKEGPRAGRRSQRWGAGIVKRLEGGTPDRQDEPLQTHLFAQQAEQPVSKQISRNDPPESRKQSVKEGSESAAVMPVNDRRLIAESPDLGRISSDDDGLAGHVVARQPGHTSPSVATVQTSVEYMGSLAGRLAVTLSRLDPGGYIIFDDQSVVYASLTSSMDAVVGPGIPVIVERWRGP